MKKILLTLVISLVCSAVMQGQTADHGDGAGWHPQDTSRYFLPAPFAAGCHPIISSTGMNWGIGFGESVAYIAALAQEYYTPTLIKIIGISGLLIHTPYYEKDCETPLFLQIRQNLDTVLVESRYDTFQLWNQQPFANGTQCFCPEFLELYFDNPVILSDTFYASVTLFVDPNYDSCLSYVCGAFINMPPWSGCSFPTDPWPKIFIDSAETETWMDMNQHYLFTGYNDTARDPWGNQIGRPCVYIFPIIDTAWYPIDCYIQTENSSVDTVAKIVHLPIHVVEFGEPEVIEIGLIWGNDSTALFPATAHKISFPFATTQPDYIYNLPADSVNCNSTYYYRAFFKDYLGNYNYAEVKSFVYPCLSGLGRIKNEIPVNLYPNPTNEQITIETSVSMTKVEIINSIGQIVYSQDLKKKSVKIDVAKFAKGNYFAKVYTSKGITLKKFVVE